MFFFYRYSEAILACPDENDVECSLSLANRSAALFQMQLFNDCISDIDAAVKRNYPTQLMSKVLLRKAKCLQKLGQDYNKVLLNLESTMENLTIADKSIFQSNNIPLLFFF